MAKSDSSPLAVEQLDGATILLTDLQADGADEVVTIENMGTISQPMTNWVLTSLRGGRTFTLPEGFVLEAGARVRIHSGAGASNNPPGDLLWTNDSIWNNKGDTAVLFGANGHEVARTGHGNRRDQSSGEKLLYREEDGGEHIEDKKPYKIENRGWAPPRSDKDPEEHDES